MAKFFKNLFSHDTLSSDKKKYSKSKPELMSEDDNKEFTPPYDTQRKLSISRSGRMKQNLKVRGTLGKDLFGDEVKVEKTNIEYHVHGKSYSQSQQMLNANGNVIKPLTKTDHHLPQNASAKGISQSGDNLNFNEKGTKRKEQNGAEDKASSNEKSDMDIEIENVFDSALKETNF